MPFATTVSLIVLGMVPSFTWLTFYLHEDFKHPEPKPLLFFTFLVGAATTFVVLPLQLFLNDLLPSIGFAPYSFIAFTVLAGSEEAVKFLAVYLFIHKNRNFSEPLDAMIYMIVGALGFAAIENIAVLFKVAGGAILNIALLESLTLRFVGATLLHTVASGIVGYYWGLSFFHPQKRWVLFAQGLAIATVLHGVFNYLIIATGPATFAVAFVLVAGFFLLNDFEKFKAVDV